MALQLPALRSIGDSIGLDFSSAVQETTGTEIARPESDEPERRKKK
jgi:hypothetical protein